MAIGASLKNSASTATRVMVLVAAAAASLVALLSGAGQASAAGCGSTTENFADFGPENMPSACWRPYSANSPFNQRIEKDQQAHARSPKIVDELLDGGPISHYVAGDEERDWGIATFYADENDPIVEVDCIEPWGNCELEGVEIRVPEEARPSGKWPLPNPNKEYDSHLTIIDTTTGTEYDLWNVRTMTPGRITTSWGGVTTIDGDGLGSGAVAANYGSMAGLIRNQELQAGKIKHALSLNVPCTSGHVYPATAPGYLCKDAGLPVANAPAMGARFQLNISPRRIRKLGLPTWKKAIMIALSKYGAYATDTSGVSDQWSLKFESPANYTAYGMESPYVRMAKKLGLEEHDYNENGEGEFWFNLANKIDWTKLRVVP